jgi:hypothetical protein
MKNIKTFENYLPFSKSGDTKSSDIIRTKHLDWLDKFPELKMLKLNSDYYDKTWNWLYSLNKKTDDINIDLFIEIEKKEMFNISFELIMECEDEYLVNNKNDKSHIQDEKHYEKKNLNWEELNFQLKKVCEYIRIWNRDFEKENGYFPLVD